MAESPTRRDFLHASGSLAGGAWLAAVLPDVEAAVRFARAAAARSLPLETLTPAEARTLGAAADRIVPPADGAPGALELGVVHFMDRAVGTFFAQMLPAIRGAAAALDGAAAARRADSFAELTREARDEVLTDVQGEGFFFPLRMLTVMGTFADPSWGGNRDGGGWAMVAFEPAPAFRPPFGWYDARYREGKPSPDRGDGVREEDAAVPDATPPAGGRP